jgi:hypothetical protein
MTMKNNKQPKPAEELYIQVWRNPIFYGGLLTILTPEDWQTLTGLAMFMDVEGECYPKLDTLGQILGLNNIASVSRRIRSLENKTFEDKPILTVTRSKEKNEKGTWQFANNRYKINPLILTIFAAHPTTLNRRNEQTEDLLKRRAELSKSFSFFAK